MKLIKSFQKDHTTLERGIYVSREDFSDVFPILTYDIRMKAPYRDVPLRPETAHTLEEGLALVEKLKEEGLSTRDAVKRAAAELDLSKKALYDKAIGK